MWPAKTIDLILKTMGVNTHERANILTYTQGSLEEDKVAEALNKLSYDDIRESRAAIGTPERLIERFIEWRDVAGIDGVVMELNAGNLLGEEQISNSVRLIAEKVMPAFK